AACQAWYEDGHGRVIKKCPADVSVPPAVTNTALANIDARGVGQEVNNLTAIHALKIHRAFRFGKNIDMILTDNRSYMGPPNADVPQFDFGGGTQKNKDTPDQSHADGAGDPPPANHTGRAG